MERSDQRKSDGAKQQQLLELLKSRKLRSAEPLVVLSLKALVAATLRSPMTEEKNARKKFQTLPDEILQRLLLLISKSREDGVPLASKTEELRLLILISNCNLRKFSCEAFNPLSAELDQLYYKLLLSCCPKLEHFCMSPRQLFPPEGTVIPELPVAAMSAWPYLKVLRLPGHRATDRLLRLLSRSLPALQLFEIGATKTGLTAASAKFMAQMQNLKDLRIHNRLEEGADIVDAVVHIAGQVPNLQTLDFETDKMYGIEELIQSYGIHYPNKKLKICRATFSKGCTLKKWPSCLSVEQLYLVEKSTKCSTVAKLFRSFPAGPTTLILLITCQSVLEEILRDLGPHLEILVILWLATEEFRQTDGNLEFIIKTCPNLRELHFEDYSLREPFLPGSADKLTPKNFSNMQILSTFVVTVSVVINNLPQSVSINKDLARVWSLYYLGSKNLPTEMQFVVGGVQECGLRNALSTNPDCLSHLQVAKINLRKTTTLIGLQLAKLLILNVPRLELVIFESADEHLVEHQSHQWFVQLASAAGVRIYSRLAIEKQRSF